MKKIVFLKIFMLFIFVFVHSGQRYNQLFIEKAIEKRNFEELDDEILVKIARNYYVEYDIDNFLGTLKNIKDYEIKKIIEEESFKYAVENKNYAYSLKLIENLDDSLKTKFYLKLSYRYIDEQNFSKAKNYLTLSEQFLPLIKRDFNRIESKILLGKGFGIVKDMSKSLSYLSSTFWEINRLKDKDKKSILLVELYDSYKKLNLLVNSKLLEIQIDLEKDPECLLLISEKFYEKGDNINSKKYLDLAYKNKNFIKNNVKKAQILSQITNRYSILNEKKKVILSFNETIKEAKGISKREDRIKIIMSVFKFNDDENLDKLLVEDIFLIKDRRLKNEMFLKLIETYLIKGEEEKGFLLLKIVLNELRSNKDENLLFYLQLISEMYADYGSVSSCMDYINILKKYFKNYPSVIAKMYIYKNDFYKGIEYIRVVKDVKEKIPLLYLYLEETFKKDDNSLNNDNLIEALQIVSKIDNKKFKSLFLLDLSYLLSKYNVSIDNRTLYYLETI